MVYYYLQIGIFRMDRINIAMYTQMGFSETDVKKAYEYSKKNKVDIFDGLQKIQQSLQGPTTSTVSNTKSSTKIPNYSFLKPSKSINLLDYETLYSRHSTKESVFGRDEIRDPNTPVGLFNVSNCCYLNSLLQCYFLMGTFTREILQAEQMQELPESSGIRNKRVQNQYKLLDVLKEMFSRMKMSSRRYLDPTPVLKNLVNSVGQKIEYGDEKDLNEINMEIVERLSEGLMFTRKYYSQNEGSPTKSKKRENLKNLFYGQKVEEIEGMEGQNVSQFMGIILNPKHGNISLALDEEMNYDVEIEGKVMKKRTYIRSLPRYLFLTISRIQFEKKKNQAIKNSSKMSFDFTIYLDQYLQSKQTQTTQKRPKIRQLQNRKAILKNQQNHLNLMSEQLQQCREHAKFLKGWLDRLPKQEDIDKEKQLLRAEVEQIQHQLKEVESRDQKFLLMYVFVHRGDAISGHYWGYGKNGDSWFRFDVNCTPIQQCDILIDMQKSAGIPYALVYAHKDSIQNFTYPYYLHQHQKLPSSSCSSLSSSLCDYTTLIPDQTRRQIIEQNITMHRQISKQKNKKIIEDVIKQYKSKYNVVVSEVDKYVKGIVKQPNQIVKIPLFNNFSCFLFAKGLGETMKFSLFSSALYAKAEITCEELIEDQNFLRALQKSFRKKVKGKMSLKHFAIMCEPIEGDNYKKAIAEYLTGKKCLEFIKQIFENLKEWPAIPNIVGLLDELSKTLQANGDGGYLKCVTQELMAIMLIDLVSKNIAIRTSWISACNTKNPLLQSQLQALSMKQIGDEKMHSCEILSKIQLQQDWNLLSLRKGFETEVIGAVKEIIKAMSESMEIYRSNTRQNNLVKRKEVENFDLI